MSTTYKKLSQLLREAYYNGKAQDDANHSESYFAELIAIEVAICATEDAFINSNQGDSTYANNQFISTFRNVQISIDTDNSFYSILPATPPSLPNGQEIGSVKIEGSDCMEFMPMKQQMGFAQSLIGKIPFNIYEINGGRIIYKPRTPNFDALGNTATIKMVGAVSGADLLTSELTIPKNYEGKIWTNIMAKILPPKNIPQDLINDAVSNPG